MSNGQSVQGALVILLLVLTLLSCCGLVWSTNSGDSEVSGSSDQRSPPPEFEETVRKEMVKVQILQRLGLSEKPQVNDAHRLSKDLALEILRRTDNLHDFSGSEEGNNNATQTQPEDDSSFAKTSEIISFPDQGPILNGHTLLSFSYAGNNAYGVGVRVKKAYFWVKMDYRSSMGRHFGHILHPKGVSLYVFHITGNFQSKRNASMNHLQLTSQDVQMDLVTSRTVKMESLGWQKLDITPLVQKWYNKNSRHRIRHPGKNHHNREKLTLLVDCAGCGNSIHPIIFSQSQSVISEPGLSQKGVEDNSLESETSGKDLPFLILETETSPNAKRSRRRAMECGPRIKQCCKQRFYVSFQELGWDDWIIAPKGYYANYCRGHCGGPFRTPDTFLNYHTHVMEEYRRTSEGQANLEGIKPCCAPTKFAPMSLIYFGPDHNIIKRDLPKMIVEECGCP